jgi:hypothetical protein
MVYVKVLVSMLAKACGKDVGPKLAMACVMVLVSMLAKACVKGEDPMLVEVSTLATACDLALEDALQVQL